MKKKVYNLIQCPKCGVSRNPEEAAECPVCRERIVRREERVEMRRELDVRAMQFVPLKPRAKLQDFIDSLPRRRTRVREEVLTRRKAIVILRDHYGLTFPAIGRILGYADHTSAIHNYQQVSEEDKLKIIGK